MLHPMQLRSNIYISLQFKVRQKESQRVQREAALAQHEQLDSMLRRQADNRIQMQAIISAHQERITQRIKVRVDKNKYYSHF